MVCSCAMPSNCVWLQIIFCTCVKETVLFSFLRSLLRENGRSLRFPRIFIKKNKLGDRMIQQLWNSVIAKYRDLLVSRTSIICRSRLLATDKSGYFAQPRPVIVNYFNRFYYVLILSGEILCWPTLLLELKRVNMDTVGSCYRLKSNRRMF